MGDLRCFWITLTKPPVGVVKRAFVAVCDGAAYTGDPADCSCDGWPQRVAALQAQVAAERGRARRAEAALERERLRISDALKRAGRDRWGRRLEALTALDQDLRRRWGANPNPEKP